MRSEFDDVVDSAVWTTPLTLPPDPNQLNPMAELDVAAICALTAEAGLGG